MRPVKRLEIVAATVDVPKVLKLLEELKVSGYTLIRDAEGMGDRGRRLADDMTDVFSNSYILVACSEELAVKVAKRVQPILERFGGVCLVSDATWIRHREREEGEEP